MKCPRRRLLSSTVQVICHLKGHPSIPFSRKVFFNGLRRFENNLWTLKKILRKISFPVHSWRLLSCAWHHYFGKATFAKCEGSSIQLYEQINTYSTYIAVSSLCHSNTLYSSIFCSSYLSTPSCFASLQFNLETFREFWRTLENVGNNQSVGRLEIKKV